MRRLGILIAPVLLVSLVGCGAFGPDPIQPTPMPSSTATSTEAAAVETPIPYPAAPDGVVATGEFESAAAETSGTITVMKRGDQFTASVKDFETSFDTDADGQLMFVLSDMTITPDMCGETNKYQIASPVSSEGVVSTLTLGEASDDPSYFETASIVKYPDGSTTGGCEQPFLGIATLDWSIPDVRPDLVLTDSGSRNGARGVITEHGEYLTEEGDVWADIAARFGITPDELEWLTPIRPQKKKGLAYDDEVLNLSKSHRGNSEGRRAYVYTGTTGTVPTE